MGNIRRLALVAALTACAACSSPGITPTPSSAAPTATLTSRFSTHEGPVIRATLPSTWTPTPTPLPSLTPTPTPITPTLTPTPVPDLADLCPSLAVQIQFPNGYLFQWNDVLTIIFGTPLAAVRDPTTQKIIPLTVRFLATNLLTRQNQGVQLPGGQVAVMELPINQLPGPGLYGWTIAVFGDGLAEQCAHGGFFFVYRAPGDLTPTAEVTASP